jgi:hypothetical protein
MFWKQRRSNLTTTCIVLVLAVLMFCLPILAKTPPPAPSPTPSPIKLPTPPPQGNSGRRASAGTRGECQSDKPLTALVQETSFSLTTAEYPTLFVYIPQTDAKSAEFVLADENKGDIYQGKFNIASKSGVFSLTLPVGSILPALEVGKNYHWGFSLICDAEDRARDVNINGSIQRVNLSADLVPKLENASMRDRINIYLKEGIWHDAFTTLASLRRENPNDSSLAKEWANMLQQVDLKDIAEEPIN